VARAIDAPPVDSGLGWEGTPLWYYVLLECDGERLGPVGATIVGEVRRGLFELDPESYLAVDPDWRPSLPAVGRSLTSSHSPRRVAELGQVLRPLGVSVRTGRS
jgi:hypothetical protein